MGTTPMRLAGAFAAIMITLALPGVATAQVSAEQQSALRANCRSDFMSKCSGVTPGGKEALTCLQKNVATLSQACKTVVSGTIPKPRSETPPPPAVPAQAETPPPVTAPTAPTVTTAPPPAPPKPAAATSPPAPKAAAAKPPAKPAAPAKPATAAAIAPVPAPGGAPAGPSPEKLSALKFTCRRDFARHCKGVPPGPEAFMCLQAHQAQLSPNCRTSVASVADDMPVGVAMPAPVVPDRPVANAVVMLRACKLDLFRHCRSVEPGGGREIACLAAHEDSLSVRCRMARRVSAPVR